MLLGRAAGRPESRGEYLERNYGAGDTYSYGVTNTYDNDATLQVPVSSATVARQMATINVHAAAWRVLCLVYQAHMVECLAFMISRVTRESSCRATSLVGS